MTDRCTSCRPDYCACEDYFKSRLEYLKAKRAAKTKEGERL